MTANDASSCGNLLEKVRPRMAGPSLQTSALPLGYGANYLLRLELKWGLTATEVSEFARPITR
jgi:hypothetical protein